MLATAVEKRRDRRRPPPRFTFVCHDLLRYRRTLRIASTLRNSKIAKPLLSRGKAGRSRAFRVPEMDGDTVLALIDTPCFKCGWLISHTSDHVCNELLHLQSWCVCAHRFNHFEWTIVYCLCNWLMLIFRVYIVAFQGTVWTVLLHCTCRVWIIEYAIVYSWQLHMC